MRKCRYIPKNELPPVAGIKEIRTILDAINNGQIRVQGLALRYAESAWGLGVSRFVDAIRIHLENDCKIFCKKVIPPRSDTKLFSANVRLDPESEDEEDDVYVEIRIFSNWSVMVCDAHNHCPWQPRLPRE